MNLEADRVAELAGRPLTGLTRRDVALALLAVPAADSMTSLPGIRRGMLAAGNPLSAAFWESAEQILTIIDEGSATIGDVRTWLEASGTEPTGIIGMHVWDAASERSQLAEEMHVRLVGHLEDRLAAGEIDPDLLVARDPAARRAYVEIQERWMTSPLSDGRIPMDAMLDEKDEELFAEWDAADAEALGALDDLLTGLPDRPLPQAELTAAGSRLRDILSGSGWPAAILTECGGLEVKDLPDDDAELWLTLAAGIASPVGTEQSWTPRPAATESGAEDEGLSETDSVITTLCAIDHFDWLAVISELASGGPGTAASAADLAGYVRDFDPAGLLGEDDDDDDDDDDDADIDLDLGMADEDFDELTMEGLFLPVTSLWQVLGAIGDEDQLTPLGWWGLPEALRRVWTPAAD